MITIDYIVDKDGNVDPNKLVEVLQHFERNELRLGELVRRLKKEQENK